MFFRLGALEIIIMREHIDDRFEPTGNWEIFCIRWKNGGHIRFPNQVR